MDDELERIDAAVFSGDWLEDPEERKTFREYVERWSRELDGFTSATDAIGTAFVKLLYDREILVQNAGQLQFRYKGHGFMTADDLRAVVAEMDRVNK